MGTKPFDDPRLTNDFVADKPETFYTAHEEFKELRGKCPVAHSHSYNGFWSVLKYDDVVNTVKNHELFTTSVQNTVPKFAFTGRRPPLHFDPPEHTAYRRVINQFFSKEKMDAMEAGIRRDAISLLDPLIASGEGDFADEYAFKFPPFVFADFFNVPKELSLQIKDVSARYVREIQFMNHPEVKRLSLKLYDIARDIIQERKERPMDVKEDLTSALLVTEYEGEPLPDEYVLGCVRQLLVTGMVAPSVMLSSIFAYMAMHKDIQQQLRQSPTLIPAGVEEFLRLLVPYRGMARTPKKDVVIRGRLIKKDEPIAVAYASANRDEDVFPEGDKFILNRPNIDQHIGFGEGPHKCPGSPLARRLLRITLEEALKRTKDFELNGEIKMTPGAEWGALTVPLKYTPA
ncbi:MULTISPECIES: cytochrome P450 [Bacillaceae]|uniref:Cytochrome P450 n=1 Tax=Evansella alkalicola TaxID=745819 RepID=A0ABS6JT01_9BACI|nr:MULTISPECIES: cytochrome P450 [Bacillaceae]MBU9721700.1 cytochrome P450 [Bacillus alkalicola]